MFQHACCLCNLNIVASGQQCDSLLLHCKPVCLSRIRFTARIWFACAELGPRHTGCHDAAKHLEIVLAMKWWWQECYSDENFSQLWRTCKGTNASLGRRIACVGVEALQLRYDSSVKAYEARQASRKAVRSKRPESSSSESNLLQLQRRDPTVLSYKSAVYVNAYKTILEWTRDDYQDAGAIFAAVAIQSLHSRSCLVLPHMF